MGRSTWWLAIFLVIASCGTEVEPPAAPTVNTGAPTSTTTEAPTTSTTTTLPSTTTTTMRPMTTTTAPAVVDLEAGLYCRNLAARGFDYTEAVAYWVSEGEPNRMDADRNGIPCETVYDRGDIVAFWGDPLPVRGTEDVEYTIATHGEFPDPLPGSGGYLGSGCSPGSGNLPDGIWFGFVRDATESAVHFDLACLSILEGTEEECGGYELGNSTGRERVVPVDASAMFVDPWSQYPPVSMAYEAWMEEARAFLDEWPETTEYQEEYTEYGLLVFLYVNDGEVTEITEAVLAG